MTDLDELREKLTSKEEREKISGEINDTTYINLGDGVEKRHQKEESSVAALLHDRAKYLRTLVNLCFEQIDNLEAEK